MGAKHLGRLSESDWPIYCSTVPTFDALIGLKPPSDSFVLLLAANASEVDADLLLRVSANLITAGVVYACFWGADCERVHDIFDEAYSNGSGRLPEEFITTTWHSDETLDEAVGFFLTCAFPQDRDADQCSWLAVSVGDSSNPTDLEAAISRAIRTPDSN